MGKKKNQVFVSGFLFLDSYSADKWEIGIGCGPDIVDTE